MIRRALLLNFRVLHRFDRWVHRRFTLAGMLVLGGMIASGVFGIDTRTTMSSQLVTLSAALIGFALLFSIRLRTPLEVQREAPRYATVGEPVTYRLTLRNNGPKPLTGLWVEEQIKERMPAQREFMRATEPGRRHRNFFDRHVGYPRWAWLVKRSRGAVTKECEAPNIPAHGSARVDVSLTPIRRGYIRLNGVDVSRREPLGLCKARRREGESQSILVLPKPYPVSWRMHAGPRASMTGRISAERTMGGSENFSTVREYRSRDPLRQIHWPSSARLGQLVVKEFHRESDSRISVILDTFTGPADERQLEEAVSIAASFAGSPSDARHTVDTLFTVDEVVRVATGRGASSIRLLETLACIEGCNDQSFSVLGERVENESGFINTAVCVLLHWDEERQRLVQMLRARAIAVMVIVVNPAGAEDELDPGPMSDQPRQFLAIPAGDAERCLSTLGAS